MKIKLEEVEDLRVRLTEKASADDDFRSRLLATPKSAIEQELDVVFPDGLDVQVHEESAEVAHLVLPPHPKLDQTQLSSVAGGKQSGLYYCM